MWPQQGYFFQGWQGQQYANTASPSTQQLINPSDWAAKAQEWAQQRQIANQYYQQQPQEAQQQVAQWPYQQHQQHQQQQPYYTQQQQPQPHVPEQQQPHVAQQQQPLVAQQQQPLVAQQQHPHAAQQQQPHAAQQQQPLAAQQQQPLAAQQQQPLAAQQQQPLVAQQQQPHVAQHHQAPIHQQPHMHQRQQGYGMSTVQQQVSLHQQQQQQQASIYQQQQGGAAPTSSQAIQHQQSHSLLSQPMGGERGVAGRQGQLSMQTQAEHHMSATGSNPSAVAPEPLFPQHNTPPMSSQASSLASHAYQPHPPQSQQQHYGSSPAVPSLLGESPRTSVNVGNSPQSGGATPENLLGRSPAMSLKPRALLEPPQPSVRPKSPTNEPMSVESGRYGPTRGGVRAPLRPQGGEEREDLRFQERGGTGMSGPPGPHPPMVRNQGQANFNVWEQGPLQSRGEIPTGPRPPTEKMFSEQKREEQFDHQQSGQQQQHFGEQARSIKEETGYQWQSTEVERHGELARDFQRRAQEEEWEMYGNGQNRASDGLQGDKDMRVPSPFRHHQLPYSEQSDRSNTMTSSPSVSIHSLKSDEPTISSLRKDAMTTIPGLGGGFEEQEKDVPKPAEPPGPRTTSPRISGSTQQVAREGEEGGSSGNSTGTGIVGGPQANQMIKSLGKFVTQLQTLKGVTSSLQLLQMLPKGEEGKRAEEAKPKESSEAELSEETKRKVAALLATESDSDGEQGTDDINREPESRVRRDDYPPPSHEMAAREFDGTFDVKPQVYGTYGNENNPPPQHARDSQRDYPPVDYRDQPDHRASLRYQSPPPQMEREGYRPPPRDYYPREEYEQGYRRDYPPAREPPLPERGYDYRQLPPRAQYDQRERDYDRGPPPPRLAERVYEPPPHEREYPPPSHYRGRSPPSPRTAGPYEHQTREREGSDPYYNAPCGRETGVAMEAERMMSLDHREHPANEEATDKINISSKLQTIDYSHGSAYSNVKSVDYNHRGSSGAPSSHPPAFRDSTYPATSFNLPGYGGASRGAGYPYEGYQYPPGGGGYPPTAASFLPPGLDAATLFAAYASQAGESKRKALPSWLREELEKMERKRRKEMEKEALEKARFEGEKEQRAAWRDELDSGEEEETELKEHGRRRREGREDREREERERERGRGGHSDGESRHRNIRSHYMSKSRSRSPTRSGNESPPPAKRHREELEEDEDDKQIAMIMKIRKTLTEVLLEVTNQEVQDIVLEALDEERHPKFKSSMKSVPTRPQSSEKSILAGLSMYDSDISDAELEADKSKTQPVLDPHAVAQAFKDTKASSSSKGNSGRSSSKEKDSKQGSGSHKSGSSTSKHSSSSGSSSSKKEKSSSSKSEKSSSSSSSKSTKKSSSSKKDTDEHHSSSSSKHSKSDSKSGSSSKSSSSSKSGSKSSGSDKDSKSKHSSSSSSSKSQSNRSPSPHRRSSSSSKQKDTESGSKSLSSKSSHKSESKSSRRRSASRSPPSSSSGRKHSRHHKSRSRSRSRSPGHGTSGAGSGKRTSSSSRKSPQRSTPGSYRHVQIRD